MPTTVKRLPSHGCLAEPDLAFHPDRPEDRHVHPLVGLEKYGPYSRATVGQVQDPIRVATISAHGQSAMVAGLLAELESRATPRERKNYLIDFTGMSRIFGVRVVEAPRACRVELSNDLDRDLKQNSNASTVLARRLTEALSVLECNRTEFDVVLLALPQRWEHAFQGGAGDDFDLHDYLKAITAARGLPLQIILESSALAYHCRCSVCWRLAIALYCKAGGVPWKLADTDPDSAFIGLTYAMRAGDEDRRFVICCSQVFDADGTGLEFIAYEARDVTFRGKNPYLSRADMRRVMARSLALYQRRHAGAVPRRVSVHKSTPFKEEEVEGCFDAWKRVSNIELVQVQQNTPWRAVELEGKGKPNRYPCQRGSFLHVTGRDAMLWTQGNLSQTLGKNYYKEGKGIPSPLMLTRFAGHTAFGVTLRDVLGLTKMDWNNDAIYDRLPVTMGFASVLARTVKRMPRLSPRPYQIRYLM